MKLPLQNVRKAIPWYVKFGIKLVRGTLPINYNFFATLGFFRHGKMDDPQTALNIFNNHFSKLDIPRSPFVMLELGPGDSLFTGIIAAHRGASASYLVDHGDWISRDITKYLQIIELLYGAEYLTSLNIKDLDDIKRIFNISHLTKGLDSLRSIPFESIDISFSNAVLEHVYAQEVQDIFKELKRISKKDTLSSHFIDFKDHLAYSLNNLRFSKELWEKDIVKKSGIYTNRLRFSDFVKTISSCQFQCAIKKLETWEKLPIKKNKMHTSFSSYEESDLLIKEAWVRLT